jgi:hypothetical protein
MGACGIVSSSRPFDDVFHRQNAQTPHVVRVMPRQDIADLSRLP